MHTSHLAACTVTTRPLLRAISPPPRYCVGHSPVLSPLTPASAGERAPCVIVAVLGRAVGFHVCHKRADPAPRSAAALNLPAPGDAVGRCRVVSPVSRAYQKGTPVIRENRSSQPGGMGAWGAGGGGAAARGGPPGGGGGAGGAACGTAARTDGCCCKGAGCGAGCGATTAGRGCCTACCCAGCCCAGGC